MHDGTSYHAELALFYATTAAIRRHGTNTPVKCNQLDLKLVFCGGEVRIIVSYMKHVLSSHGNQSYQTSLPWREARLNPSSRIFGRTRYGGVVLIEDDSDTMTHASASDISAIPLHASHVTTNGMGIVHIVSDF